MISTTDIIQLLPDHVANQIAAGEVVQRPASAVKELIENSVDAGATEIDLIVKDAGRTLIRVIDNGSGMSVTDLRMAFERHATSKIRTTEDIFNIQTKGFRGEALPSIAAVAQIEAITRMEDEDLGTKMIIEGGTVRDQLPAATQTGTSISVKNLFYNVPARRNFLKSNQVELKHIQDEFLRVALAHEHINFRLFHNDSEVYILKDSNLKQRIVQIFGRKIESNLVPITEETEVVKISGYIGKPEASKKQRGEQYFFVNHRFIRSNYLHKAVMDAFENLLQPQYVPSYFLYLDIDPSKIDINIHPTKTEIKFEDEYSIYAILRAAVKHSLGQFNVAPSLDFDQHPDWAFIPSKPKNESIKAPQFNVDRSYNPFRADNEPAGIRKPNESYQAAAEFIIENQSPEMLLSKEEFEFGEQTVIQWMNSYLITKHADRLLIIDQNRAHQLVIYKELKNSADKNVLSQRLLFPIEIESNQDEIMSLKNFESELFDFGFDVEFDNQSFRINALPVNTKPDDVPAIFSDFLEEMQLHDKIDFQTEILKIISKNTAVKKGEPMLPKQAEHLAQQLLKLDEPNFTPYGKRVFVQFDESEISKKLN